MSNKKKWIVVYFKDGEVIGPVWNVESKIKPTRWANRAFAGHGYIHKIKEVVEFSYEGYKDSYLKSLA